MMTTGRSEYQLTGPRVFLSPGAYELRADVTVGEGGVDLGVLNADADTGPGNARTWYGKPGFGSHDLLAPFEADQAAVAVADPLDLRFRPDGHGGSPADLDPARVERTGPHRRPESAGADAERLVRCRGS